MPFTTAVNDLRNDFVNQRFPLLVVLAFTLLAKGGALLPGYAVDDYGTAADGPGIILADVLSKGRVGHWLFLKAAIALQVEPNAARILFVSFSIIAYSVFGLAVIRFWRIPSTGWLAWMAAGIIANHPYTCEIFTFRIGLPLAAIVIALLTFLLFLACRPRLHAIVGSVVFALALSFYQIALHFAFMIVLMGAAIGLCRYLMTRPPTTSDRPVSQLGFRWLFEERNMRLLLFILSGGFLYYLAGALFGQLLGVSGSFFEILPINRIPARVAEAATYIFGTFARPNVLIPPAIQLAFAVIVGFLMIGLLRIAFRRASWFHVTAGVVLLLCAALLWSVGVFLFLEGYWPVPRNMAHVGIFWAGCLVLAALILPRPWVTRGLTVAVIVILISFVGVSEHILDEQRRLNTRDLLQANRIIARLESLPGFIMTRRVAFVGGRAWYPVGVQRTQWGDMNISGFGAPWSQTSLLREASGYNIHWSMDPQEKAAAEAYCADAEPWPAQESIAFRGDVAFVCFGQPRPH